MCDGVQARVDVRHPHLIKNRSTELFGGEKIGGKVIKVTNIQHLVPTIHIQKWSSWTILLKILPANIWKLTTQYKFCLTDADARRERGLVQCGQGGSGGWLNADKGGVGVGSMRTRGERGWLYADKGRLGSEVKNWQNLADVRVFYGWPLKNVYFCDSK